jgi:hypothetical protein
VNTSEVVGPRSSVHVVLPAPQCARQFKAGLKHDATKYASNHGPLSHRVK